MASRFKRLVSRRKSDAPPPELNGGRYGRSRTDLSSQPYETASAGQQPVRGTTPIRSSQERTSSQAEPRRSKRFSRSSHSRPRSQVFDHDLRRSSSQQLDGIPHADNLYDSEVYQDLGLHQGQQYSPSRGLTSEDRHSTPLHPHHQHAASSSYLPSGNQHGASSSYLPSGNQHGATSSYIPSGNQYQAGPPPASLPQASPPRRSYNQERESSVRFTEPEGQEALQDPFPRRSHHQQRDSSVHFREPDAHQEASYSTSPRRSYHQQRDSGVYSAAPDGQEILNRAQYDSEDIGTAITTAPAVVHEVIHREIHHVREEQITRDVHDYDVYHRMLPIVDVEVLPARHFLPAEGGGLVEIENHDAPGRGKHWIIAETASKIPSNQPANLSRRQFSARAFPGTEGDTQQYYAPEGHPVTEQTWVHPPELETGARDTGQSWPIEFGRLSLGSGERPKSHGSKSPHRRSIERKPVARR